jgi:hypothetical protein
MFSPPLLARSSVVTASSRIRLRPSTRAPRVRAGLLRLRLLMLLSLRRFLMRLLTRLPLMLRFVFV